MQKNRKNIVVIFILLLLLIFVPLIFNKTNKDIIDRMEYGIMPEEILKMENIPETDYDGWKIVTNADDLFPIEAKESEIKYEFGLYGELSNLEITYHFDAESEQTITERNKIKKYFFDKYGEIERTYGWYYWELEDKDITLVDGLEDEIKIKCSYKNLNDE